MATDWWAIAIGMLGALLGAGATLGALIPQLRRMKRDAAARYQETMADALASMAAEFDACRIPHDAGHTLEVLLEAYEIYMGPFLGSKTSVVVKPLLRLAKKAKAADQELAMHLHNRDDLSELVKQLQRTAGELRAMARKIGVGGHSVSG